MKLISPTDPILWKPANAVTDIAAEVLPHLAEMKALMAEKGGVGLAAPQVGIPLTFFIWLHGVVINPTILSESGFNVSKSEGCLTWPGLTTFVPRRQIIKASWTDENNANIVRTLVVNDARIFAHEFDHLNGVCIFKRQ